MSAVDIISGAETIVIKIGSALISHKDKGTIKQDWLNAFAQDVHTLIQQGKKIVIVSSGGIALGRPALGISTTAAPSSIPLEQKQAASAVGQFHMFHGYYKAFEALGTHVAQVLLTMSETENRRMHLNARETLYTLMDKNIIPVINENDTVSTGEIRFGDNDRLATRVAQMINADVVILLSTSDGLYTNNPDIDPQAEHLPVIEHITEDHIQMAGDAIPGLSTGGMKSKLEAADAATRAGIPLIIANGVGNNALKALCDDKDTKNTLFMAQETRINARKRWISSHLQPKGQLFADDGALKALQNGSSLLPIGVKKLSGNFRRGDIVQVLKLDGTLIGTGISAYSSEEALKIIGQQSKDISNILGYAGRDELIHRNDLALQD